MRSRQLVFYMVILFLIMLSVVYANPVGGEEIKACSCSVAANSFEIQNTADKIDTFVVTQRGTASKWSNIFPEKVILEPGEVTKIENFINPPCNSEGEFSLITNVESSTSIETILQSVVVEKCSNIKVVFKNLTQSGCNCSIFEYEFSVTNTGNYNEIYTMKLLEDVGTAAATSLNPIILGPGESKRVELSIVPPCDVYGEVSTVLRVSTEESGYYADAPLILGIEACPALPEIEEKTSLLIRARPMLILMSILFLIFCFSLILYYAVFGGERDYYKKVGLKEPTLKKKVDKSPEGRFKLKYVIALIILLIIAFLAFKGLQQISTPLNDTINESIQLHVNETQEVVQGLSASHIKNSITYLYYFALGLALLFLVLLLRIKLEQKKLKKTPTRKWVAEKWRIVVVAVLLIVIVILVYLLRARIAALWVVVKDFLMIYLAFIIMGFILLGILLFILAKLRK